jgi:hypothetical protein
MNVHRLGSFSHDGGDYLHPAALTETANSLRSLQREFLTPPDLKVKEE